MIANHRQTYVVSCMCSSKRTVIGTSEAKPSLLGGVKTGSLGPWVVGSCVVSIPNYMVCTFVRRGHTIDGTYVVHIPILVHTSSLERALNPANRRGHLTSLRSSFHRGLHKATSGEVRRVRAVSFEFMVSCHRR